MIRKRVLDSAAKPPDTPDFLPPPTEFVSAVAVDLAELRKENEILKKKLKELEDKNAQLCEQLDKLREEYTHCLVDARLQKALLMNTGESLQALINSIAIFTRKEV